MHGIREYVDRKCREIQNIVFDNKLYNIAEKVGRKDNNDTALLNLGFIKFHFLDYGGADYYFTEALKIDPEKMET